jgi:hypothetical protein
VTMSRSDSQTKYVRAHKRLAAFAKKSGMTAEGKSWLIAAVDPFHDVALDVQGIPDRVVGKSIVQCVKRNMVISVGNDEICDVLIHLDTFQRGHSTIIGTVEPNYMNLAGSTSGPRMGGCNVFKVDAGQDPLNPASSGYSNVTLQLGDEYLKERSRVISRGFEVHNTTPALYKGGNVICFKNDQTENGFTTIIGQDAARDEKTRVKMEEKKLAKLAEMAKRETHDIGLVEKFSLADEEIKVGTPVEEVHATRRLHFVQSPPRTSAEAVLLPNTKGWEAAKGCYVVASQMTPHNPPTYLSLDGGIYTVSADNATTFCELAATPPDGEDFAFSGVYNAGTNLYSQTMNRVIPFNGCGAYFTGLPSNTELNLYFNEWIERFPNQKEENLVALAKPSACYDPIALEAYAHIVKKMPIGREASANGLGDWFCDAVSALVDWCTDSTWASEALGILNKTVDIKKNFNNQNSTNQGGSAVKINPSKPQFGDNRRPNVNAPKTVMVQMPQRQRQVVQRQQPKQQPAQLVMVQKQPPKQQPMLMVPVENSNQKKPKLIRRVVVRRS